jgi:hypothetical protein
MAELLHNENALVHLCELTNRVDEEDCEHVKHYLHDTEHNFL